MRAPHKEKPPERELIEPFIGCFVLGLIPLPLCFWVYLRRDDLQMRPGTTSVSISLYESLLDLLQNLVFYLIPVMGLGFVCMAYLIWKAYRKCKLAREGDCAGS